MIRRLLVAALVAAALVAAPPTRATNPLKRLHVANGVIVDTAGRQVLLRGVNVNQLGDYYQADPAQPPTLPLAESDAEAVAGLGMNVVRLLVHWSALEPQPGVLDAAYIARIRQAIAWFARHDVYVVVDMHQDAWGKYIATPPGATCPPGLLPSVGWDGAPKWATITDGLSTCHTTTRELAPAVGQAWQNFWLNRPGPGGVGIQTRLVRTWGKLVAALGPSPAIAGYDLLNEPNPGYLPLASDVSMLALFHQRATSAIRSAERSIGIAPRVVFVEPGVLWSGVGIWPANPLLPVDGNVVFAPHLYAGSIAIVPIIGIAQGFLTADLLAKAQRTTFWSGEWGWFGNPATDSAAVREYARFEDRYRVGGAWWDWKQACGDPHNHSGATPTDLSPSLNRFACPGDIPLGIPAEFAAVLSRPYPRAAPGKLATLTSDPATGALRLTGSGYGVLELWAPDRATGAPSVTGKNLGTMTVTAFHGGFRLAVPVHGDYALNLRYSAEQTAGARCCTPPRPASPLAALSSLESRQGDSFVPVALRATNHGSANAHTGAPAAS